MKRIDIEKIFKASGIGIGDKILVTERYARGRTGQRYFTLDAIHSHSLRTSDSDLGKKYIIDFNKIEDIESAEVL
jgi:hypothetical protein